VIIFGFKRVDNEEFKPQNEFKLDTWVDLPGPLDINKGVLYVVIAAVLSVVSMVYVANRMQARPNRVQTAGRDDLRLHPRRHRRRATWTTRWPASGSRSWPRCSSSSGTRT
jgi:hypothetical protein